MRGLSAAGRGETPTRVLLAGSGGDAAAEIVASGSNSRKRKSLEPAGSVSRAAFTRPAPRPALLGVRPSTFAACPQTPLPDLEMMPNAAFVAAAMIVICGLTPTAVGNTDASAM